MGYILWSQNTLEAKGFYKKNNFILDKENKFGFKEELIKVSEDYDNAVAAFKCFEYDTTEDCLNNRRIDELDEKGK